MRYAAFLSYSHALDGRLAPALQRALQRFAKRWHERRALSIFRDETSLSTNPALWQSIEAALAQCDYLILLASPAAAQSVWIAREVAWWRANRPMDHLLIVLTEGELLWDPAKRDFGREAPVLPEPLRGAFSEEPRWLDLRWTRKETDLSLQHPRFKADVADLAATLHGRPKDDLLGEDIVQHRRQRLFVRGAIAALLTLTIAAGAAAFYAFDQAEERHRQQLRAEAARKEAVDSLVQAVQTKLNIFQAGNRPDLELALVLRLLSDPAFSDADFDRQAYVAKLPTLIGSARFYLSAPWVRDEEMAIDVQVPTPGNPFYSYSVGFFEGRPVAWGAEEWQDGHGNYSSEVQLRDLLTPRVLAVASDELTEARGDSLSASFIADSLLLFSDWPRQLWFIDDTHAFGFLDELPAPPQQGNGSFFEESLALMPDYVLDATAGWDDSGEQTPIALHGVLWLDGSGYTALDLPHSTTTDGSQIVGPDALELRDLDEVRLLLLSGREIVSVDLLTGSPDRSLANPFDDPLRAAGYLGEDGIWAASDSTVALLDSAGKIVRRRPLDGDAIVAVKGDRSHLIELSCDHSSHLLDGGTLQPVLDLPQILCDPNDKAETWKQIARLLPNGDRLGLLNNAPDDRPSTLFIASLSEPAAVERFAFDYPETDFAFSDDEDWVVLSGSDLVFARSDEAALLAEARAVVGKAADQDLGTLLGL